MGARSMWFLVMLCMVLARAIRMSSGRLVSSALECSLIMFGLMTWCSVMLAKSNWLVRMAKAMWVDLLVVSCIPVHLTSL